MLMHAGVGLCETGREIERERVFMDPPHHPRRSPDALTLPKPLQDSGAQYKDGTTDVTRTVHFGTPTEHQRHCCTLVLKVLREPYFHCPFPASSPTVVFLISRMTIHLVAAKRPRENLPGVVSVICRPTICLVAARDGAQTLLLRSLCSRPMPPQPSPLTTATTGPLARVGRTSQRQVPTENKLQLVPPRPPPPV